MASVLEHPQGLALSLLIRSRLEAESTQIPQLNSIKALALPATAGVQRVAAGSSPSPGVGCPAGAVTGVTWHWQGGGNVAGPALGCCKLCWSCSSSSPAASPQTPFMATKSHTFDVS